MKCSRKTNQRFRTLLHLLQGREWVLIVLQDNPDPDSIAAAMALRKLANTLTQAKCSIAHAGTVGRAENRALVEYLDLHMHPLDRVDFSRFDLVALVDVQPGSGNCSLPNGLMPDIVFDHHPFRRMTHEVQFHDVRRNYGSVSTILLEYLTKAGIEPETPLATALLYAVRSDTQDLGREASGADIEAIETLYPLANKRILSTIQRGRVPRAYFGMLASALKNAQVYGQAIVTSLGAIDNPDMVGEVADLFLRAEQTAWTLCMGSTDGRLLLSIRTTKEANRADLVAKQVVARRGTGGGHLTYAGGQVPLKVSGPRALARLETVIRERFLQAIGLDGQYPERLIQPGKKEGEAP